MKLSYRRRVQADKTHSETDLLGVDHRRFYDWRSVLRALRNNRPNRATYPPRSSQIALSTFPVSAIAQRPGHTAARNPRQVCGCVYGGAGMGLLRTWKLNSNPYQYRAERCGNAPRMHENSGDWIGRAVRDCAMQRWTSEVRGRHEYGRWHSADIWNRPTCDPRARVR